MMCTSSTDGLVKVWDISNGVSPIEVETKNMQQGELFSLRFCEDIPWVLAAGGSTGQMAIWDTSSSSKIEKHFKGFLIPGSYNIKDYDPNEVVKESKKGDQGEDEFEDMDDDDQIKESKKEKKDKKKKKKEKKEKKVKMEEAQQA